MNRDFEKISNDPEIRAQMKVIKEKEKFLTIAAFFSFVACIALFQGAWDNVGTKGVAFSMAAGFSLLVFLYFLKRAITLFAIQSATKIVMQMIDEGKL